MKSIGKYQILGILGRGGMGIVYKARDPDIEREVAIKTVHSDSFADGHDKEELLEGVIKEAKAAGRLNHPNIITIYDVIRNEDMTYIVMQYVEGQSLEALIASGKSLSPKEILNILKPVSDALDFSIKVFDSKGRVLLRAGRPGTGPGEFQAVRELAVSRDHVFVLDQQQPKVLVFDKQLRFLHAIPQPEPISCLRTLPDGTLAAALVPTGKGKRPSIWLADNRGRTLQEIEFGADAAHPAGDRASFVLSGRDVVLAYSFKNKVERLDRSGRVIWSKKLLNFPDARFKSAVRITCTTTAGHSRMPARPPVKPT